jgi:hypothetical protein
MSGENDVHSFRSISPIIVNYKKIMYILHVSIFTFWMLNIHSVSIIKYLPDAFYYVKSLSLYYWSGILLIIIVFILNIYIESKSTIKIGELNYLLLIVFIALYLYGTTSYIYPNPRTLDVYAYTYQIDCVGANSPPSDPMYFTQFQGSTLMFSIILQCSKISSLVFAKYYPIYLMIMLGLFSYVIAKRMCDKYCIVAPVAIISLGWVQEYHISPQSHVLILVSILFCLLTLFLKQNPENFDKPLISTNWLYTIFNPLAKRWGLLKFSLNDWLVALLIILTWSGICISHALTPMLVLIAFTFTSGLNIFLKNLNRIISPKASKIHIFLGPFLIIYIINLLNSSVAMNSIALAFTKIQSNLILGKTVTVVDKYISTPASSYVLGYHIRMSILLFTMICGFICLFIVYLTRENMYYNTYLGSTYLAYAIVAFVLVIVGYNVYGFDRCYMLLLIPYSIICSMLLDTNVYENKWIKKIVPYSKIFIVLFTVSSLILLPITQNASDPYNFISDSERAGKSFCFKVNSELPIDPINEIYPTSVEDSFYTFYYNHMELKNQEGYKYINKISYGNIIYDSGQYKTSRVLATPYVTPDLVAN